MHSALCLSHWPCNVITETFCKLIFQLLWVTCELWLYGQKIDSSFSSHLYPKCMINLHVSFFEKHEPFGVFISFTRGNIILFFPFCAVVYITEYKWDCQKLNWKYVFYILLQVYISNCKIFSFLWVTCICIILCFCNLFVVSRIVLISLKAKFLSINIYSAVLNCFLHISTFCRKWMKNSNTKIFSYQQDIIFWTTSLFYYKAFYMSVIIFCPWCRKAGMLMLSICCLVYLISCTSVTWLVLCFFVMRKKYRNLPYVVVWPVECCCCF